MAYLAGRSRVTQLTWFDRSGKEVGKVGPRAEHYGVTLSPNGQMVAVVRQGQYGSREEWVYDLARGPRIRLTPPGASVMSGPVWPPDGSWVIFTTIGPAGLGIYQADLKGGAPQLLEKLDAVPQRSFLEQRSSSDWSRDGRFLIYTESGGIWYVPLESGRPAANPVRFSAGTQGQLSRDRKLLAYALGDGVQIRPFPTGAGIWQVPASNSFDPRWRSDGKELYFISGTVLGRGTLMVVPVETDGHGGLRIGSPQRLFEVRVNRAPPQFNAWSYAPSPDGTRFLVNALVDKDEPTVNVITNWQAGLLR